MHSYSVLSEADCQTSAQPWLLFVCASSYANAKPLRSELCCNLHRTSTTKKKCLSRQVPSHNLFLAFHKQPQVSICCVYGRPKLCLFTFFLPLWSAPRNTEEFNYMVTGALTRPRFCFNHPTVRYKEVQGRLCYVCVCARSDQWAMQWHQQAQWDRDGEILILVDLYENFGHTSRIRLALKMFKLIHNRVAKRWKISSKFWKHSRNFGNFPGFFWNLPGIYGKFPPLCNPNI